MGAAIILVGASVPPSIMLVIMADLLGRSVGNLFVAAVFPVPTSNKKAPACEQEIKNKN